MIALKKVGDLINLLRTMNFKLDRTQAVFSISSTVLTVGLFFLVTMIMSETEMVSAEFNSNYLSNPHVIPMFLLSAISWFLVGLNEEMMYRGYMVATFKHLSITKLFLVSSFFFAFSHIFINGLNPLLLVILSAAITLMYVI
ncbi:CPBP family intramembrane glutamic endopeptidase [Bacillus sp. T33-2]|uniref:CPBP family intramembrane glutamic endopeptidase n=1 Tax=Bacillus sp. T33-2 TaxID=2054168 RepID=UPI000C78C6E4|nr:CPBP family intramembrane glutamic endopeptidase [Bacillus sp. T33-2]PLR99240.1 hypothetical protein CVD19_02685 [Bacillus sp. T33-2]